MLSKRNQTQKAKYYVIYLYDILKKQNYSKEFKSMDMKDWENEA